MNQTTIRFLAASAALLTPVFLIGCAQNYPTHIVYSDTRMVPGLARA